MLLGLALVINAARQDEINSLLVVTPGTRSTGPLETRAELGLCDRGRSRRVGMPARGRGRPGGPAHRPTVRMYGQ